MFDWLKNLNTYKPEWEIKKVEIGYYPSERACFKKDMSKVRPQSLPPLMVRKAAWRKG